MSVGDPIERRERWNILFFLEVTVLQLSAQFTDEEDDRYQPMREDTSSHGLHILKPDIISLSFRLLKISSESRKGLVRRKIRIVKHAVELDIESLRRKTLSVYRRE